MAITAETRAEIIELVIAAGNSTADACRAVRDALNSMESVSICADDLRPLQPSEVIFKLDPIHPNSSRKGRNRNRYWEGS